MGSCKSDIKDRKMGATAERKKVLAELLIKSRFSLGTMTKNMLEFDPFVVGERERKGLQAFLLHAFLMNT